MLPAAKMASIAPKAHAPAVICTMLRHSRVTASQAVTGWAASPAPKKGSHYLAHLIRWGSTGCVTEPPEVVTLRGEDEPAAAGLRFLSEVSNLAGGALALIHCCAPVRSRKAPAGAGGRSRMPMPPPWSRARLGWCTACAWI